MAKPATQEIQDLMSVRWVADMIGVAAELELADFINAGAKTAVIGARNEHDFAKILDIQMLVHFRGKERTRAEWKELLHATGFQLTRVVPASPFVHVMEAVRIN